MLNVVEITTEYRTHPVGLDRTPRFSWKLKSDRKNTVQEKYQLQVLCGKQCIWDSGVIKSGRSVLVPYCGKELEPFTEYTVLVQVWDNHGETGQAESGFETGLLKQENWQGEWITHKMPEEERMCPAFVKRFETDGKKIRSARAYMTACGIYELSVNGEKAGDAFLAPGWTAYHKRLQYQTYDITGLLKEKNEIRILLGNGWYKGYLNGDGQNCFYGSRTAVLGMFRIVYEDGSVEVFGTDTLWEVQSTEIAGSELYHGETQDFTLQNRTLHQAVLFAAEEKISKITAQESEPVRIVKRFPAIEKIITPKGETVLDFGQNIAGFVEVRLPILTGTSLRIRHAETLDADGNFYTENLRTAKSTDEYIYTSEMAGMTVHPHFTYHGFRYICLEGVSQEVDEGRFTACAIHTDMRQTGTFACENPLITQLQSNIEWSTRDNFVDIPTDCPQRDERLGWTGDAAIFAPTAAFQFQTALVLKKWLRDLAVETDDEHGVPHVVPNIVGPSTGTAVWSDAAVLIPWTLYRTYGDEEILREQYETMRRWVEYVHRACAGETLWIHGFQRGDWLSLDGDASIPSNNGGTDKNLVANIFYANSLGIVSETAKILGRTEDAELYRQRYEKVREALNDEYVTKNGRIVTETQTACALFLYFDLIDTKHQKRVIQTLAENVERHKGHLTTGFIGTAYLLHVLTETGNQNLAEEILLAEDYPGWLYAVKRGATTIWERWNSILPDGTFDRSGMNSLNHYTYGSVGDWLYRKAAGIRELEPGYKRIHICPVPVKTMREVKASFESMYGTISCRIRYGEKNVTAEITIPENTTAVIELPGKGETIKTGSGTYHFEYEAAFKLDGGYSLNSTIGEIMADERGAELLCQYLPGTENSAMLSYLKGKTLQELTAMAPQMKEAVLQLVEALNG